MSKKLQKLRRKHRILMLISLLLVGFSVRLLSFDPQNRTNAGWNADMWINNSFWEQNPSDGNIITALFGNGTPGSSPYNRYWTGFCLPNKITYVHNMAQIKNMVRDTIYIIEDGFYYIDSNIKPADCTAIIGKGTGEVIFSGAGIELDNGKNIILDNLIIDGDMIVLNGTTYSTVNNVEIKNTTYGLKLLNSNYNRLNRIKSHNNMGGIYINGTGNFISESELFNNNINGLGFGIELHNAYNNIINNCQIYNNNDGIHISLGIHNSINNSQIYNNREYGAHLENSAKNLFNNSNIYSNYVGLLFEGKHPNVGFEKNENLLISGNIYNNYVAISSNDNKNRLRYYNTIGLFSNNINYNANIILVKGGYEDESDYKVSDLLTLLKPNVGVFKTDINMDRYFRTYPVDSKGIKFITPISDYLKGNLDWIPNLQIKYIAGKKIIKQTNLIGFGIDNQNTRGTIKNEHNPNYFIASIDSETSELDDAIIKYYYGSYTENSEFTKNWNENNCNINVMTVEHIYDQTGFFEKLLGPNMPAGHTIYVLADGNYNATDEIFIDNDCTAIVNYKGNSSNISYYPGSHSLYSIIYVNGFENNIFDGLKLNGQNNSKNNIFFDRDNDFSSKNSTLNNIQSFKSLGNGINLGMLSNYITIMNTQTWNNNGNGIEVFLAGEHNIINNTLSYNNANYGIRFGNKSKFNSINNSQFFNNNIGGIFSDLNTESNILNNIHTYNNKNFGINFKRSSGNVLNKVYSYNNKVGLHIEEDSSINNIYISDLFVFSNSEYNLSGTNGTDQFLMPKILHIPGFENILGTNNNVDSGEQQDFLVSDLSNGIGIESNISNTGNTENDGNIILKSTLSNIDPQSNNTNTDEWNLYDAISKVLSGYYFKGDINSAWTDSYKDNCSGNFNIFSNTSFEFGKQTCKGNKEYNDGNTNIEGIIIQGFNIDDYCDYKIPTNSGFSLSFKSEDALTGFIFKVGDEQLTLTDISRTGGIIYSGSDIISNNNYSYTGTFDSVQNLTSGNLSIEFNIDGTTQTGLAEFSGYHILFSDNTGDIYLDLRDTEGFEIKNKGIYLKDDSIFILKESTLDLRLPIYIGKCSAIIGQNGSALTTNYDSGLEDHDILYFKSGSKYSILDNISFKIIDGGSQKIMNFDSTQHKYYSIVNNTKTNEENQLQFDTNISYTPGEIEHYVKFLPIEKIPVGDDNISPEIPTRKIISDLEMSCQFVTNPQNISMGNRFFQNSNCNQIGFIPTWDIDTSTINVNYVFGNNISKQIPIVGYFGSVMSGLNNQYISSAYIGEINPIIYTNPGSISFSGAFINDIETGINYEIGVNFTNFGMFNHNFDIILNFTNPEDIEGHLEIMRNNTRDNIGTGLTDINYKEIQAIRIIVKTPEKYLQEIEGSLYIGTQEYGNNTGYFWIQTKADQTPPTISRVKNIANGGIWEDGDNIWQVRVYGKNDVKVRYDYVDSPKDCNSGITMNEYHNLSEINIKRHPSGASSLNNKYVCVYAKDIVSSVVTTGISNQIKISNVIFTDDIMPGPVYYDSVQVNFNNTYNYGYTWVVNKGKCNETGTISSTWNNYNGLFILNSSVYNNKYMCIKALDSEGNQKYFVSDNSVNILGRENTVYFIDGVNPSWNNEDIIDIGFSDDVEFTTKEYKRVSNILECSNTGGMTPYEGKIIIDNEYFNGFYFCLYTLESGSNIENYLISPTNVKVDITSPINPTIISPENQSTLYYLVFELTGSYDKDAGIVGYEYQISNESSFSNIVDEGFAVYSGNIIMPKFNGDAGQYFIRFRAVDNAGNTNPWNEQQSIGFEYKSFSDFAFVDVTGADISKSYLSNTITIQGIGLSGSLYVEITNGTLFKNGIAKGTGTQVEDGDTISIRMSSSDKYEKTVSSNLIILSKIISWNITTKDQDPILKEYNIDNSGKDSIQDVFNKMLTMYSDEGERMEMFYTMKSMLQDEIALDQDNSGRLKYMLYLINNYLDDDGESGGKIHTAPNCKKYEISYDGKKKGYYSPDMKVSNGKISYFDSITDLLRFIDSKNTDGDCGYHIYKNTTRKHSNDNDRHIAPSGKIYDISFTTIGYTSQDLVSTKYFASIKDLQSYINQNNPSVSLLSWDHTVDSEFTPQDYTAPNGKIYKIYHTDKGYMSYKFLSVKYFKDLDVMKLYINKNNPKL